MAAFSSKRLQKELAKIHQTTPPGITFVKAESLYKWLMDIRVLDDNVLYSDKVFRLEFRFGQNYPIEPPEVVFLPSPTSNSSSRPSSLPKFPGFSSSTKSASFGTTPVDSNISSASGTTVASHASIPDASSPQKLSKQPTFKTNTIALDSTLNNPDQWDGVPIHPHIYSNGIICLDLLDKAAWSPVHNVESVCISLQSMLTSNDKNERPPNDMEFCKSNSLRPKDIRFLFHDDRV